MSYVTNVPTITWSANGVTIPAESDILTGVLTDMNNAFGGGMSQLLTSPQGQLAQSLTAIIGDKNNQMAYMASMVNPATSEGRWQDAIGRIYFIDRIAASGTVVTGTCTGLVGTVIPAGSIVQDSSGYQYQSTAAATIGSSGTVDVDFQCATTGPIACPVGALNTIYKAVTGWESVTNAAAGTSGTDVESRADFEYRRKNSVATNAVNSIQSIRAAVLAVPNVLDAYVIDNSTNAAVTVGATSYSVAANSVYVAVVGGASADVAKAIWENKSLGCSYNGATSYTYTDTSGGVAPYPTYTVKWETPASLPIYFAVSIANNSALPSKITTLVQTAIVNAFNGADGGSRARIGSTIYAGRFYAGVAATDSNVEILSIYLGTAASPTGTSVDVGIDQRPTLDTANISVTLV